MSSVSSNGTKWMDSHTAARAVRISEDDWDRHRATIFKLHDEGKTKQEISTIMAQEFRFAPTQHQYTTQFKKWKLTRYNKSGKSTDDHASSLTLGTDPNTAFRSTMTSNSPMVAHEGNSDQAAPPYPFIKFISISDKLPEVKAPDARNGHFDDQTMNPFADPPQSDGLEQSISLSDPVPSEATEAVVPAAVEHFGDVSSETESIRMIDNPFVIHENDTVPDRYSSSDPGIGPSTPRNEFGVATLNDQSVDDLNDSIYAMSIQDSPQDPFANEPLMSPDYQADSLDGNSVWESITSRSEISLATNRGSQLVTLTDRSKAIPTYQYLDQLFPRKKLKKLRKFATEHLFCDYSALQTLYSILAQADFFRVSLLFSDAFDLYLLAYILLVDKKVEKRIEVHKYLVLQALAGCAESARNLSQVRLCQEFLSGLKDYEKNDFLHATGFPLSYWQGHLATLESQSNHAAVCILSAVSEVGRLPFKDSASVTSVLVRKLTAHYQHMSLPVDATSRWLVDAQRRLDNGEFAITIATALRKLLEWCISNLEREKLEVTVEDCFSGQASACIKSANGDRIPQYTFMLVVHFYCSWAKENRAPTDGISWVPIPTGSHNDVVDPLSSTDRVANALDDIQRLRNWRKNAVNEAIGLISQEVEINLLSMFTTLSRMIVEQSPSLTSQAQEQDVLTTIKDNATALTQLSGEQLEAAFVKAYFFVNARAPDLGSGLHPQRYLRALAVHNMPRGLIASEIGPDWLTDAATEASGSVRSLSMHSPNESTRQLLQNGSGGALPQISPRSSISVRFRDALAATTKRKYQPSISSRQSAVSQYGVPTKMLKMKKDTTGGSGSTTRKRNEAEREFMMMLGQSMTSLNLCE